MNGTNVTLGALCVALLSVIILTSISSTVGIVGYVRSSPSVGNLYGKFIVLQQNESMFFNYSNLSAPVFQLRKFESLEANGIASQNGKIVIEADGWYGLMSRCILYIVNRTFASYTAERFGMFYELNGEQIGKVPYSMVYKSADAAFPTYYERVSSITSHKTWYFKTDDEITIKIIFFRWYHTLNGTSLIEEYLLPHNLLFGLANCSFSAFSIDVA